MKYQAVLQKVTYKKIALGLLIIFLISLLPILYCSFFDYATGDDLWLGCTAYRVLVSNGSASELFSAMSDRFKAEYNGWEGNWSSIILWLLSPNIWGEKVYCITPWIALLALCGGHSYFFIYYLRKYLKSDLAYTIIVSIIVCFFSIQYMPSIRSGIFWYSGVINYIFPYGWCLASFVWIDKFLETGKIRYCIFTVIVFAYLGGAGYPPIVFAFEILLSIILYRLVSREYEHRRRVLLLFLPLILLLAGFVVSAISPGNAVRGGESYYFSVGRIFTTLLECIKRGAYEGCTRFFSVRPLFLAAPLLCIASWEQIDVSKSKVQFKHPMLVICFLFLVSCSVYAPEIYSQADDISGGVPDTVYFVFLLAYIFSVIYLTCYFKKLYIKKQEHFLTTGLLRSFRVLIICGELLFCIVAGKYLIDNMTSYICIDFIRTGQLSDFEYQMQERLKILNDPQIVNAVVPEMNDQQGPFMHMALLNDPNSYTNYATARYYGKESVIAIPRPEYYEKYGYPED